MKSILILAVVVAGLVLPAAATGHFDTGHYTHKQCPVLSNGNRVDPINFVFWDWGTIGRANNSVGAHAGWFNPTSSPQSFVDHGNCYPTGSSLASAGLTSTRFHIRMHPIHQDPTLGWTTVGAVHHEDFVTFCPGHAVDENGPEGSGFDQGRKELRIKLEQAGHGWYSRWWGNTEKRPQCDDGLASSDGYVVYSRSHQSTH